MAYPTSLFANDFPDSFLPHEPIGTFKSDFTSFRVVICIIYDLFFSIVIKQRTFYPEKVLTNKPSSLKSSYFAGGPQILEAAPYCKTVISPPLIISPPPI